MWYHKGSPVEDRPEDAEAFVYLLEFADGMWYIGKKNCTSTRRLPPLKGKKRKRVVVKESNWKTYRSSSEEVKEKIAQGQELVREEILHWCTSKGEATYLEVYEMVVQKVLCNPKNLNKNILGRYFKCFHKDSHV